MIFSRFSSSDCQGLVLLRVFLRVLLLVFLLDELALDQGWTNFNISLTVHGSGIEGMKRIGLEIRVLGDPKQGASPASIRVADARIGAHAITPLPLDM